MRAYQTTLLFLKESIVNRVNIQPLISKFFSASWSLVLLSGTYLFFVLYFYQGFNIYEGDSHSGHGLLFRCICFGVLTSLSFYINEFYLAKLFKLTSTKSKIGWLIWEVFVGATLVFLLFAYFWNWEELIWESYFLLLREYYSVMIIPAAIYFFTLSAHKPKTISPNTDIITFHSENKKQTLAIQAHSLLFIKSENNYIALHYLENNKVKKQLLRSSIKLISNDLTYQGVLLRCHRSYLINPSNVISTFISNKKMAIQMAGDITIPVSQKYQSTLDAFVS